MTLTRRGACEDIIMTLTLTLLTLTLLLRMQNIIIIIDTLLTLLTLSWRAGAPRHGSGAATLIIRFAAIYHLRTHIGWSRLRHARARHTLAAAA